MARVQEVRDMTQSGSETQGRTTPAGHTGLSALVPDYGLW